MTVPPSSLSQLLTLLWRKELRLKLKRPLSSVCELLLPLLLCAAAVLGASLSEVESHGEQSFAPTNLSSAQLSVTPLYLLRELGVGAASQFAPISHKFSQGIPGGVPDLSLWLLAAHFAATLTKGRSRLPPYDGSHIAVAPDIPEVRELMNATFSDAHKWAGISQVFKLMNMTRLTKGVGISDLMGDVMGYKGITLSSLDYPLPEVRRRPGWRTFGSVRVTAASPSAAGPKHAT
eukprot:scaffold243473_cov26-Tisochrysis_lutea.AAC.1